MMWLAQAISATDATPPWLWRSAFLPFVVLTAMGIYLMLSHRNFLKALVGLQIFQTGIILFFIVLAVRADGTIPIQPEVEHPGEAAKAKAHYDAEAVMHNPLPHALMLTAIVVGVATQGVGLAILKRVKRESGGIEDELTGPLIERDEQ